MGWDSVVGTATCYGVDSLGIKSHWVVRFSAPLQTRPGAHPVSYAMCTRSFLGVKQLGCGADNWPPSSTEVKERVELYLYSPSGPSWPALGWNLPLHCLFIKASFWTAFVMPKNQFAPVKFCEEVILYRTATVSQNMLYLHAFWPPSSLPPPWQRMSPEKPALRTFLLSWFHLQHTGLVLWPSWYMPWKFLSFY